MSLSHSEIDLYHQQAKVLSDIGFDIELLSGDTLSVRSVPEILVDKNVEKLIKDVLSNELLETAKGTIQNTIDLIIATCACHAAVRFGDILSINEIQALLEQMDTIDLSSHCPHGRPVIEVKNRNEIERWFHR
mgnify:FL=1